MALVSTGRIKPNFSAPRHRMQTASAAVPWLHDGHTASLKFSICGCPMRTMSRGVLWQ